MSAISEGLFNRCRRENWKCADVVEFKMGESHDGLKYFDDDRPLFT